MMTHIPIPMYCPSCYTTLACEERTSVPMMPVAPLYQPPQAGSVWPGASRYTALWCPQVGCGQYYRSVTGAEFAHLPESDQNKLRWLLDRTEAQRGR